MISLSEFLNLDPHERWLYFERAASEIKIPVHLIEKDFWVTLILDHLFNLKEVGPSLTFKGGTSLSKVFNLISRFSEDIDVSIEKSFLGFEGERLLEKATARKQCDRLLEELQTKCQSYVQGALRDLLISKVAKQISAPNSWKLEVDEEDPDRQTLLFHYPTGSAEGERYVRPKSEYMASKVGESFLRASWHSG